MGIGGLGIGDWGLGIGDLVGGQMPIFQFTIFNNKSTTT